MITIPVKQYYALLPDERGKIIRVEKGFVFVDKENGILIIYPDGMRHFINFSWYQS
jgi:hypothetical protein